MSNTDEQRAKDCADHIMAKIKPLQDAAVAKAERLQMQGDWGGALIAFDEGLREVNKVIMEELLLHAINGAVIEPLKRMLGIPESAQ